MRYQEFVKSNFITVLKGDERAVIQGFEDELNQVFNSKEEAEKFLDKITMPRLRTLYEAISIEDFLTRIQIFNNTYRDENGPSDSDEESDSYVDDDSYPDPF